MAQLPLRIGHRGAAGHAPENTLLSMRRALEIGVDLIEIDVQMTADRHLVVLHDKRVDRTARGTGYVSGLALEQVQSLEMPSGERIPTLIEVLSLVSGRSGLMIELIEEGIAKQVLDCVRSAAFSGDVIYASFLHAELLKIRAHEPSAQTLALLEGVPVDRTSFAQRAQVTHVGLAFDSASQPFVRDLQAAGYKVFVYSLDDFADINRALEWKVDGIISNFPERIRSNHPAD